MPETGVMSGGFEAEVVVLQKPKRVRKPKAKKPAAPVEPRAPRAKPRTLNSWARAEGIEKALKQLTRTQKATLRAAVRFDPVKAVADAAERVTKAEDEAKAAIAAKANVQRDADRHLKTISEFRAFAKQASAESLFA